MSEQHGRGGPTRGEARLVTREYRGKTYSFDEGRETPFLEVDGRHIMVVRQPDGRFYSHHFFRSYDSLDEMAQDLILFDPEFKERATGQRGAE